MREIIVMLLSIIEAQKSVIAYLCILVFGKAAMLQVEKPIDKAYLELQVDPLPVFGKPEIQKVYDCDALIAEHGIKPIRRRGSSQPPSDTICPHPICMPTITTEAVGSSSAKFVIRLFSVCTV